jgi:hypothetical protein
LQLASSKTPFFDSLIKRKTLIQTEELKSLGVQGNCGASSNLSILSDLEESTAGRVEYPPLKPFQCVSLIDKPLLQRRDAPLWLDSLYIALTRTRMQAYFSILENGKLDVGKGWDPDVPLYITNSTFVGEGRGSARAISTAQFWRQTLIEGATESCQVDVS